MVEMDTLDYVSTSVLLQYDDDNVLHASTDVSKMHSPAECNFEIYSTELMVIVGAFEEWHRKLQSATNPICILSDHKPLQYFKTTKLLNHRQAHWSQFLSQFDLK
jgi:hypothetical protein